MASTAAHGEDDSSVQNDALMGSGADVWASEPSHPPAQAIGIGEVTTSFDESDPFKPESQTEDTTSIRPDDAPDTPAKRTPPLPVKQYEASPASAIHDLAVSTPTKSKNQNDTLAAPPMTPTASGSGLTNPLASIASAFRRSSAAGSGSRPQTPTGKAAPAILIRDKDETTDIDESEKSAPPAFPSQNSGTNSDGEDADAPPFDFNLFLEQMRSRAADPIARYLRSFLKEFTKRHWSVNEQIRVINDFLDFISIKMRENEVWKGSGEKEFDNAVEAMEKLVMNRVYHLTFIPALTPAQQAKTQTDDLERDHVLTQRIKLFGWVQEKHLDLPENPDNASFLDFAKQELLKVNTYKAPRDKLICLLNSCKVIFGLMRHLAAEDGADTFIPFLILVVLRANPEHLISNVQYIQRFRNPERLAGETGYYLSSLNGAISFIETMDSSSLSGITQQEFETRVEEAIAAMPAEEEVASIAQAPLSPRKSAGAAAESRPSTAAERPHSSLAVPPSGEHSATPLQAPAFAGALHPPRSQSPAEATRDFFARSSDNLQKTVSKPLQALGRILTEMGSDSEVMGGVSGGTLHRQQGQQQHQQGSPRPAPQRQQSRHSLTSPTSPMRKRGYGPAYIRNVPETPGGRSLPDQQSRPPNQNQPNTPHASGYTAADYVDDSISAEQVQANADMQHQAAFGAKIGTLVSIFPGIEKETLEIVLISNGEDVERTIESLLEMT